MNGDGEYHESSLATRQRWWRDRGILVGIIGVIATIAVGWLTYWLTAGAESREYQERVKSSRTEILSGISRSIGEGKVPNKAKIQAVIDSVERKYGVKQQDSEKPGSVIDDIIERVLANEFLDAQKREELSTKLLAMRDESVQSSATPGETQQQQPHSLGDYRTFAFEVASAAATLPAFISLFWVLRERNRELARRLLPMFLVVLALLMFVVTVFWSSLGDDLLKNLQKH
jgi:hypothetical protein